MAWNISADWGQGRDKISGQAGLGSDPAPEWKPDYGNSPAF